MQRLIFEEMQRVLRQLTLALVSLAALAAPASAQEWADKMFSARSHDFGTVPRGGNVVYAFKFKNLYEEDVHISNVRSSCGCTEPKVSKDTLKTFEEGEILAEFNTRKFLGSRNATLTVTFDKPFYAEVQLTVAGYIRSDVVLSPGGIEFGSVDQGSPAEKKVGIQYAGRADWKILELKSANPHLKAEFVETSRGNGQVGYDLVVKLNDDAPAGYLKEELTLITSDARGKEIPVLVEGRVLPEISVNPASLFVGTVQPGQKVTKQLVVSGKRPFKITNVKCGDSCFAFAASEASAKRHLLPVVFTAGDKPGKLSAKIEIETDLGPTITAALDAHAQIVPPSAASTSN
ncbi:MAG: DUF1573 domain-containing protein [Pirellulales bacterium]